MGTPDSESGPAAQRRYCAYGAEAVADEGVVCLRVVAGVGQHLIEWKSAVGHEKRLGEFDIVGQGPAVGDGGCEEVAFRVADPGQFGVVGLLFPRAPGEVGGCVTGFVPGGIDGARLGTPLDCSREACETQGCFKHMLEVVFFRRRFCALTSVEWSGRWFFLSRSAFLRSDHSASV